MYVKKSNFGDLKGFVVQIDGIASFVGWFYIRRRSIYRSHDLLNKWIAVQLFRINRFAVYNAAFGEGFPNGNWVNIVEIVVFRLSIEFVILDELCNAPLHLCPRQHD